MGTTRQGGCRHPTGTGFTAGSPRHADQKKFPGKAKAKKRKKCIKKAKKLPL
jgi:hypothetical protein